MNIVKGMNITESALLSEGYRKVHKTLFVRGKQEVKISKGKVVKVSKRPNYIRCELRREKR